MVVPEDLALVDFVELFRQKLGIELVTTWVGRGVSAGSGCMTGNKSRQAVSDWASPVDPGNRLEDRDTLRGYYFGRVLWSP